MPRTIMCRVFSKNLLDWMTSDVRSAVFVALYELQFPLASTSILDKSRLAHSIYLLELTHEVIRA